MLPLMKTADFLVAQLRARGVERIYGVVGDAIFELVDAIARHGGVRLVACRHEAAAGFMASAEAKLTGRPGVCMATSGPGVASLINGLGDAYADRAPVLAITGQSPLAKIGTHYKQAIDQQRLLSVLAGYTALLAAPSALPEQLALAWRAALEGRVAHLSVPKDLFGQEVGPAVVRGPEPYLTAAPVPNANQLAEAGALMGAARRPVILAGHGALPAASELVALAERWRAPVITALPAKGLISFDHQLSLGGLGHGAGEAATRALNEADLILAVATNWWPDGYVPGGTGEATGANPGARPRLVRVDAHPANIGVKAPVDCGLVGDVRQIIPALAALVTPQTEPAWTDRVAALKQVWIDRLSAERAEQTAPLHPSFLIHALERALPADAVIAVDTGDHTVWFNRAFGGSAHRVLLSGTWRSLGFAIPAAIAAAMVDPSRTVAAVVGDGAITSLLGELLTAARYQAPILIAVLNNGSYAMELSGMKKDGLLPLGTDLNNPDFVLLAEACGVAGLRVQRPDELEMALPRALAMRAPVLLDIATAPLPVPGPKA